MESAWLDRVRNSLAKRGISTDIRKQGRGQITVVNNVGHCEGVLVVVGRTGGLCDDGEKGK